MDERRWKRIESLYHAAREREPEQRDAYLRHACAGDEELRGEVESLLRHDVLGPSRPSRLGGRGRKPVCFSKISAVGRLRTIASWSGWARGAWASSGKAEGHDGFDAMSL